MAGFREPAASVVEASSSAELSLNSSNQPFRQVTQRVLPCFIVVLVFIHFCLGLAPGLLGPRGVRARFVCLLASSRGYPASGPAKKMLRTCLPHWSWKTHQTSQEQRWARSFPCCMVSFCRFKIRCGFLTTGPHTGISVIFAQFFPTTELTVCPRGAVPSRINPNL